MNKTVLDYCRYYERHDDEDYKASLMEESSLLSEMNLKSSKGKENDIGFKNVYLQMRIKV